MSVNEFKFEVKAKDFQKFSRAIESHIEIGSFQKEELSVLNNFLQRIKEAEDKKDNILLVKEDHANLLCYILNGGVE